MEPSSEIATAIGSRRCRLAGLVRGVAWGAMVSRWILFVSTENSRIK
jgi:hypothetical protein